MRPTYKHTQTGSVILGALAASSLVVLLVYLFNREHPAILLILIPFVLGAILFGSLTIQVQESVLRWSFGAGLIAKSVPLNEIAAAEPVQNAWYHGWGIRHTKGGWLYNVSGLDAVQISLKSGKQFRLGTDEPEALTVEIRSRIS